MERRELGNSGLTITPVLMGTWQAGKAMWKGIEDSQTLSAMRAAFEAGITAFDTAEFYGNGYSERILGEALAPVRHQVLYATKVYLNHLKYDAVLKACEASLKNLATDYIDLYQIHWPSGSFGTPPVPIEETMRALNQLKKQGKIRAIGVSNFSRKELEEAANYGRIDSLQPPYSLFWRQTEKELIPYCQEHQISLLAYSPLAQGLLTGKFGPNHQFDPGDHRSKNKLFQPEPYKRVQKALALLRPIAAEKGVSLAQLALAWVIAQPQTSAIVGARNAQQIKDSAKAANLNLSQEDLAKLGDIGHQVAGFYEDASPVLWEF